MSKAVNGTLNFIAYDIKLKKSLFRFFIVYILLVLVLAGLGYAYFLGRKKEILNQSKGELSIVAELKVNQIVNWRNERLADASELMPVFEDSNKISRLLKIQKQEERNRVFYEWIKHFYYYQEYKGIGLYSASLKEIAFKSKSGKDLPLGKYEYGLAFNAVKKNETVMSDLYRNEFDGTINLDIYAPVIENRPAGARVNGLIILRIDPNKFLYPFIQSWPVESKTFETLIVRKDGDKVLYLNKLRFLDNAALSFSVPLNDKRSPAALAANGFEGVTDGLNHIGREVVAAIKAIPDSTWVLVAKIDKEEVYAPVRRSAIVTALLVFFSVSAAGAILGFLWRRQTGNFYKKQYEIEMERKVFAKRYDYLVKYANVIMFILNKDLRIMEANDKAISSYQYSQAELLQMNLKDLQAPETLETFANELKIFQEKGSRIFKTINKCKDGKTFPVEVNLQRFVIEWSEFYQAIIRDLG